MKTKEVIYQDIKNVVEGRIISDCYLYKEEPFTLASGKQSNHYFNLRKIVFDPTTLFDIVKLFMYKIEKIGFPNYLANPTLGADAITYSCCNRFLQKGQVIYPLIVRKEKKKHGTNNLVEGIITPFEEMKTTVLEDVCTTGGSTLKVVNALRNLELKVENAICLLDREEGATELLEENGIKLYSIFKKSEFI